MCAIGLFQIRLSIFFYFLLSSGTNRRRTFFFIPSKNKKIKRLKFHRKYAILKPVVFEVIQQQNPYLTSSTHQEFDEGKTICFAERGIRTVSSQAVKLQRIHGILPFSLTYPVLPQCSCSAGKQCGI